MHRIALSEALTDIDASSKLERQVGFLPDAEEGRARGCERNGSRRNMTILGKRATIDLRTEFG